MTEKIDLRIIKTKSAIKQAFWKLLTQEDLSKITIKEIINEAQVNRATLYKYYANKYDLLDKVEIDLIDEFTRTTKTLPESFLKNTISDNELRSYYSELTRFIYKNGEKFSVLLSPGGDPSFLNKLISVDKNLWQKKSLKKHLAIPEHYVFSAIIGMAISIITEWVNSGFEETPQEFFSVIERVIIPIFSENMVKTTSQE